MDDPGDQNDEEAEPKREVRGPECHEASPQTPFGARIRKAELEDQQGTRDGKHAIAVRFDAAGALGQCDLLSAVKTARASPAGDEGTEIHN